MIRLLLAALMLGNASANNTIDNISTTTDAVPDSVLEAWLPRWSESVGEVLDKMSDVFEGEEFSKYGADSRAAALKDFNSALAEHISWERMGADVTGRSLLQSCGADLLRELEPYFSDPVGTGNLSEELRKKYQSCWINVDQSVSVSPMYAAMEFAKNHMKSILARHGIYPSRM